MRHVSSPEDLRGKRIGFVTAGYEGKRFIFEKAKKLGVVSTIIDSPSSWSVKLLEEGIIDNFVGVGFDQDNEEVVSDILSALRDENIELDGVCTFAELSLPIAALLAKALALPGESPEVVSLTRDKHRVRKVVAGAGLNEIKSHRVRTYDDLLSAGSYVGFPCVMKPISGADSLGVKRADSYEDLMTGFREMQDVVGTLVVTSGALSRPSSPSDSSTNAAGKFIPLDLSIEEYLDGPEVDVDIVLFEGDCYFAAVVDNGPTIEPFFAETWNLCPSLLDRHKQEELISEALSTLRALGFKSGIFHVEQRYTSRGPRIIEVNARMGGGPIRLQHKYVFGVDLVVEQLLISLGLPPSIHNSLSRPLTPNRAFVSATPNCIESGTIHSTDFLEKWIKNRPDLVAYWEFVKVGDDVVGTKDGHPSWICEMALGGEEGPEPLLKTMLTLVDELVKDVAANYCTRSIQ
jgi:biotin carboxylase